MIPSHNFKEKLQITVRNEMRLYPNRCKESDQHLHTVIYQSINNAETFSWLQFAVFALRAAATLAECFITAAHFINHSDH